MSFAASLCSLKSARWTRAVRKTMKTAVGRSPAWNQVIIE